MNKRILLKTTLEILDELYFKHDIDWEHSSEKDEKLVNDITKIIQRRVNDLKKENLNNFIKTIDFEKIRKSFGDAECRRYLKDLINKN